MDKRGLLFVVLFLIPAVSALNVDIQNNKLIINGEFSSIINIYYEDNSALIDVIDFTQQCNNIICKGSYNYELNKINLNLDESYYFNVYDYTSKQTKRFNFGFRGTTSVIGKGLYEICSLNEECASGNCVGPEYHCCPIDKECYLNNKCYDVGEFTSNGDYVCSNVGEFETCDNYCSEQGRQCVNGGCVVAKAAYEAVIYTNAKDCTNAGMRWHYRVFDRVSIREGAPQNPTPDQAATQGICSQNKYDCYYDANHVYPEYNNDNVIDINGHKYTCGHGSRATATGEKKDFDYTDPYGRKWPQASDGVLYDGDSGPARCAMAVEPEKCPQSKEADIGKNNLLNCNIYPGYYSSSRLGQDRCCGDDAGEMLEGGDCVKGVIPIKNEKDSLKYSDKEVFLISDKSWRDVLPLVPLTTWTGDENWCQRGYGTAENVCVYPTLIYHEENKNFEDSILLPSTLSKNKILIDNVQANLIKDYMIGAVTFSQTQLKMGGTTILSFFIINPSNDTLHINEISIIDWPYIDYLKPVNGNIIKNIDINPYGIHHVNIEFWLTELPPLERAFDVDSIIYFMQQYNTNKVTIVGQTPQELDNLLIIKPELGVGLEQGNIQRISTENYLDYWNEYKDVVYVEDDYELALLASTYASLINAPLIIKGTELDKDKNLENRNIICVGNVNKDCNEDYSLEELQKKYVEITKTDKIILVNPNDLNIIIKEEMRTEKSSNLVKEWYSKTSLVAPILASAKHEIIIPVKINTVEDIDRVLEEKANKLNIKKGFLTVLGTPDAIESRVVYNIQFEGQEGIITIGAYADIMEYSIINEDEDKIFDLIPGRIFGISISDVSSYVNRAIFYDVLLKSNSILTLAGDFSESIAFATAYEEIFDSLGYDSSKVINYELCCPYPSPNDYANKFFIYYDDHASFAWLGLSYYELPYLDNTFIFGMGCSSCIYSQYKHPDLMCTQALRKGAIGYWGMFEGGGTPNKQGMVYSLFTGKSLGESYLATHSSLFIRYALLEELDWRLGQEMFGLLGDPTLRLNPPYKFPYSEVNKIDEDTYKVNLKVVSIPTNFSHISQIGNKPTEVNVNRPTYIFSSATKENNIMMYYNDAYVIDSIHIMFAIKVGPLPVDKIYNKIEVSGNFENYCNLPGMENCATIAKEEWINGQRYLWIVFSNGYSNKLPFTIIDTEKLFETIKFQFKLK